MFSYYLFNGTPGSLYFIILSHKKKKKKKTFIWVNISKYIVDETVKHILLVVCIMLEEKYKGLDFMSQCIFLA